MLTEQLAKFALLGAEWVLYVLLVLSVVSIVVIIDRAIFMIKRGTRLKELELSLGQAIEQGEVSDWAKAVSSHVTLESRMLTRTFNIYERRGDVPEGVVESIISEYRQGIERFLTYLGTLGNNAPFVGLFGTVIGIIKAFHTLSGDLESGAAGLMGDIYEALVATGAGLAVAIPAVIAFNAFIRSSDNSVSRFNALLHAYLAAADDKSSNAQAQAEQLSEEA
jgi:biopolymer transport protein ExbB